MERSRSTTRAQHFDGQNSSKTRRIKDNTLDILKEFADVRLSIYETCPAEKWYPTGLMVRVWMQPFDMWFDMWKRFRSHWLSTLRRKAYLLARLTRECEVWQVKFKVTFSFPLVRPCFFPKLCPKHQNTPKFELKYTYRRGVFVLCFVCYVCLFHRFPASCCPFPGAECQSALRQNGHRGPHRDPQEAHAGIDDLWFGRRKPGILLLVWDFLKKQTLSLDLNEISLKKPNSLQVSDIPLGSDRFPYTYSPKFPIEGDLWFVTQLEKEYKLPVCQLCRKIADLAQEPFSRECCEGGHGSGVQHDRLRGNLELTFCGLLFKKHWMRPRGCRPVPPQIEVPEIKHASFSCTPNLVERCHANRLSCVRHCYIYVRIDVYSLLPNSNVNHFGEHTVSRTFESMVSKLCLNSKVAGSGAWQLGSQKHRQTARRRGGRDRKERRRGKSPKKRSKAWRPTFQGWCQIGVITYNILLHHGRQHLWTWRVSDVDCFTQEAEEDEGSGED